jgi:hypothetical protein
MIESNNSLRIDLISKGKARLKEFSWTETAMKTADVYKKVLL